MTGCVVNGLEAAALDEERHSSHRNADDFGSIELACPLRVPDRGHPAAQGSGIALLLALDGPLIPALAPRTHQRIVPALVRLREPNAGAA